MSISDGHLFEQYVKWLCMGEVSLDMAYFPHISGMISREFSGDGGRSTEEYRLGHAKQFEGVALDTGEFG